LQFFFRPLAAGRHGPGRAQAPAGRAGKANIKLKQKSSILRRPAGIFRPGSQLKEE
jgi:hypothetical protein